MFMGLSHVTNKKKKHHKNGFYNILDSINIYLLIFEREDVSIQGLCNSTADSRAISWARD